MTGETGSTISTLSPDDEIRAVDAILAHASAVYKAAEAVYVGEGIDAANDEGKAATFALLHTMAAMVAAAEIRGRATAKQGMQTGPLLCVDCDNMAPADDVLCAPCREQMDREWMDEVVT